MGEKSQMDGGPHKSQPVTHTRRNSDVTSIGARDNARVPEKLRRDVNDQIGIGPEGARSLK
jgi:hypothetical protein